MEGCWDVQLRPVVTSMSRGSTVSTNGRRTEIADRLTLTIQRSQPPPSIHNHCNVMAGTELNRTFRFRKDIRINSPFFKGDADGGVAASTRATSLALAGSRRWRTRISACDGDSRARFRENSDGLLCRVVHCVTQLRHIRRHCHCDAPSSSAGARVHEVCQLSTLMS